MRSFPNMGPQTTTVQYKANILITCKDIVWIVYILNKLGVSLVAQFWFKGSI